MSIACLPSCSAPATSTFLHGDDGDQVSLRHALTEVYDVYRPSADLIALFAERSGDLELNKLLESGDKEALDAYLYGKDTLDLMQAFGRIPLSAAEFCRLCKPIAARAYSISSSPLVHDGEVHITVASVRWDKDDREHKGLCSTYLADLVAEGESVGVYFSANKHFRIPDDSSKSMIMVGPGTGIAPFRAFLEEREATRSRATTGCSLAIATAPTTSSTKMKLPPCKNAVLSIASNLAWSRDQKQKITYKTTCLSMAQRFLPGLRRVSYFFVCGDAYRMAKDVDQALHQLISTHGSMSADEAVAYVAALKKTKRYVRDVLGAWRAWPASSLALSISHPLRSQLCRHRQGRLLHRGISSPRPPGAYRRLAPRICRAWRNCGHRPPPSPTANRQPPTLGPTIQDRPSSGVNAVLLRARASLLSERGNSPHVVTTWSSDHVLAYASIDHCPFCILIVMGIVAYIVSGMASVTALIPSFAGGAFLLCGLLALKASMRMHAMHAAAVLSLIGIGGSATGFTKLGASVCWHCRASNGGCRSIADGNAAHRLPRAVRSLIYSCQPRSQSGCGGRGWVSGRVRGFSLTDWYEPCQVRSFAVMAIPGSWPSPECSCSHAPQPVPVKTTVYPSTMPDIVPSYDRNRPRHDQLLIAVSDDQGLRVLPNALGEYLHPVSHRFHHRWQHSGR